MNLVSSLLEKIYNYQHSILLGYIFQTRLYESGSFDSLMIKKLTS